MSVFNSAKFKALKRKFYDRLKRSGFRDIEDDRGNFTDHKTTLDLVTKHTNFRHGTFQDIQDYYIWAEHMIVLGKFQSTADKKIWRLHAMGKSSREIAIDVPLDQSMICRKIKKIRAYLQSQSASEKRAA